MIETHQYYQQDDPHCEFLIVERTGADGERLGRLYVDRWPDQIRLVDISRVSCLRSSLCTEGGEAPG